MLYDRWRQIVQFKPDEIALRDLATGGAWTFGQLHEAACKRKLSRGRVVFAQGASADFLVTVLAGWRAGRVVCPLDSGQGAPEIKGRLPLGVIHLKTTSATTGAARLVGFTADQLAADARNIVQTMGLRPDWPNLGVISLAHSYGFSSLVLTLLLHGIPLIACPALIGAVFPEALRLAAASASAVTLPAVPALWQAWHEANAIPANIRLAISASAPLPLQLERAVFKAHGLKIHNFYGSTECGGIAYDATCEPREEQTIAGTALRGVRLGLGQDGCLEVRGEAVGLTYWPEPGADLEQGCFRSRDLAEIRSGQIHLRGRASDQINVAGRKVLPETIERALAAHPNVRECLAFGVACPAGRRGETIVACVAAKQSVTEQSLRDFVLRKLPAWQVPRHWWFVPSLSPNARGKLSRAQWRARYLEAAARK